MNTHEIKTVLDRMPDKDLISIKEYIDKLFVYRSEDEKNKKIVGKECCCCSAYDDTSFGSCRNHELCVNCEGINNAA